MKKILLFATAALLLMACQQVPVRYTNSSPEIDIVKELIKDYNDGNWSSWVTHYADTAKIYHNATDPSNIADVMEGLKANAENTSSYGFVDKDMFHEMVIDDKDEKWVNFWATWEGTMAANGKKLVVPVHLTVQFVDGKIVEEHGYYDRSQFVLAMQEIEAANKESEEVEEN